MTVSRRHGGESTQVLPLDTADGLDQLRICDSCAGDVGYGGIYDGCESCSLSSYERTRCVGLNADGGIGQVGFPWKEEGRFDLGVLGYVMEMEGSRIRRENRDWDLGIETRQSVNIWRIRFVTGRIWICGCDCD